MDKDSIIKLREDKDMTQAQLADELGVHKLTVSRWERGEAMPSQLALRQLERIRGL